jgi:RNA polymerase sigma-70 factor (ECF subfamily)
MTDDSRIEQEDRDFIHRMASKDGAALDAFYTRYNRLVFGLLSRILPNRADAEDVLTEVFFQIWQQSSRYDPARGKPVAWLLTIARTRAIDRLRSAGRQPVQTGDSSPPEQEAAAPAGLDPFVLRDMRHAVQEALKSLPEQQRVPLEMAYFQGMSHTEIADALAEPLGTVKDRIRTGMMHLRKRLRSYL